MVFMHHRAFGRTRLSTLRQIQQVHSAAEPQPNEKSGCHGLVLQAVVGVEGKTRSTSAPTTAWSTKPWHPAKLAALKSSRLTKNWEDSGTKQDEMFQWPR